MSLDYLNKLPEPPIPELFSKSEQIRMMSQRLEVAHDLLRRAINAWPQFDITDDGAAMTSAPAPKPSRAAAMLKHGEAYRQRRLAAGDRLVRVWMAPDTYANMVEQAQSCGTIEKAIGAAINLVKTRNFSTNEGE